MVIFFGAMLGPSRNREEVLQVAPSPGHTDKCMCWYAYSYERTDCKALVYIWGVKEKRANSILDQEGALAGICSFYR